MATIGDEILGVAGVDLLHLGLSKVAFIEPECPHVRGGLEGFHCIPITMYVACIFLLIHLV